MDMLGASRIDIEEGGMAYGRENPKRLEECAEGGAAGAATADAVGRAVGQR